MIDGCSLVGCRDANQDAFATARVEDGTMLIRLYSHGEEENYSSETNLPDNSSVLLVADGMGGLENGEQASFLAIDSFLERLNSCFEERADLTDQITATIEYASSEVISNCPGSGTTLVGLINIGEVSWIFNVGDSKCIARSGERLFRSIDHSPDQSCQSNIITSYVGMEEGLQINIDVVYRCDSALLFTDGLNPLFLEEGFHLLDDTSGCEPMCQKAIEKGSTDNVTCVRYRFGE